MKKRKIQKWDEVNGAVEIEEPVDTGDAVEDAGAGPSISRNPMRGVEDMVEQNDNFFDGVINNVPEPKPAAQMTNEDVVESEIAKKSVLEKLRENTPEPAKDKPAPVCAVCFERNLD